MFDNCVYATLSIFHLKHLFRRIRTLFRVVLCLRDLAFNEPRQAFACGYSKSLVLRSQVAQGNAGVRKDPFSKGRIAWLDVSVAAMGFRIQGDNAVGSLGRLHGCVSSSELLGCERLVRRYVVRNKANLSAAICAYCDGRCGPGIYARACDRCRRSSRRGGSRSGGSCRGRRGDSRGCDCWRCHGRRSDSRRAGRDGRRVLTCDLALGSNRNAIRAKRYRGVRIDSRNINCAASFGENVALDAWSDRRSGLRCGRSSKILRKVDRSVGYLASKLCLMTLEQGFKCGLTSALSVVLLIAKYTVNDEIAAKFTTSFNSHLVSSSLGGKVLKANRAAGGKSRYHAAPGIGVRTVACSNLFAKAWLPYHFLNFSSSSSTSSGSGKCGRRHSVCGSRRSTRRNSSTHAAKRSTNEARYRRNDVSASTIKGSSAGARHVLLGDGEKIVSRD